MKLVFLVLSFAAVAIAQSGSKPLATVNGIQITEADVQKAAAGEMESLEMRRLQFEAGYNRDRHELIEKTLEALVQDRLLAAEAAKRGIAKEALIQAEVDAKITPPTEDAVRAFYETNKARINVAGDPMPQIRQYLMQQARAQVHASFIQALKVSHAVSTALEPHRADIATQGSPSRGPESAAVTIVEFSDFECPFCASVFPTIKEIEKNYAGKVRLVFRQFPLNSIHPNAQKAAEASLCADDQQRFWEMHDALFANIRNIGVEALRAKAAELKLDTAVFNACLDNGKHAEAVKQDQLAGIRVGVTGTPALLINGRLITGAQPYAEIAKIIDDELRRAAAKK